MTSSSGILAALGPMEGLGSVVTLVEPDMAVTPGLVASVMEFAAEGLWLTRRIDKDEIEGTITYGSSRPPDETGEFGS